MATRVDVNAELRRLRGMTVPQLQARYAEVWNEPARSKHKEHLVKRIIWRMQALAEGDLSERARQRAAELADDTLLRLRPPQLRRRVEAGDTIVGTLTTTDRRLPMPGALLTREYKGRMLQVRVLPKGFEYDGQVYRSLSAVAKAATGSHWNGNLFFGVAPPRRRGRGGDKE